jgi:hypothetical protein
MFRKSLWVAVLVVLGAPCHLPWAYAEVTRFEITQCEPFAEGETFGEVGAYERIIGRVHYAIDPKSPQNHAIVDLEHAPRNDRGQVEFSADVFLRRPKICLGRRARRCPT